MQNLRLKVILEIILGIAYIQIDESDIQSNPSKYDRTQYRISSTWVAIFCLLNRRKKEEKVVTSPVRTNQHAQFDVRVFLCTCIDSFIYIRL